MIGKLGVLVAVLGAVFLVFRLANAESRRVERKLSKAAEREAGTPKTLERDPETGTYRARDERGPKA